MNPTFSLYRTTPPSPSRIQRLEVAALDLLILIVAGMQSLRLTSTLQMAWQFFDSQPAVRQSAILVGLGLVWFCIGLLLGAI